MATKLARTKTILEALKDDTVPNALIGKVLDAYGFTHERGTTLTINQKAAVFIRELRRQIRQVVLDAEVSQAAATAADAARPGADIDVGSDDELGE